MNVPLVCLLIVLLAVDGFLFWRHHHGLDVWSGKPLPIELVRRHNPGLRIVQASPGFYIVRDQARSLMAYVSFVWGLPTGQLKLSLCGSRLDTVLPKWIPRYQAAHDAVCAEWADEIDSRAGVTFTTDDSAEKVYQFYKTEFDKMDWPGGGSENLLYDRQGREQKYGKATLAATANDGRQITVYIFRWGTEHTVIAISFQRAKA